MIIQRTIKERELHQAERTEKGTEKGQLTAEELAQIKALEDKYIASKEEMKADGLSKQERIQLQGTLSEKGTLIKDLRHSE